MTDSFSTTNNITLCVCGCGQVTVFYQGKYRKYIYNHNHKGRNAPHWKGGIKIDKDGYILIWKPDHHYANSQGYVRKHRLVYEEFYRCCLLSWILIHHKDSDKQNNNINNIEPMSRRQHRNHHFPKLDISNRYCLVCKSDKTYVRKNGQYVWYKYENGYICSSCYDKRRIYV